MPKMIRQETFAMPVTVATTHSFLELAEETGMIASADEAWSIVQNAVPDREPGAWPNDQGTSAMNQITPQALGILLSYSAGTISASEAAGRLGPDATLHDVFAKVREAGLPLPRPPRDVELEELRQARRVLGLPARD